MVLRLLLYILFYLGLAGGAGYLLVLGKRKLLGPSESEQIRRRHRLLGAHNADDLKIQMEEVCAFCDKPVDPDADAYEAGVGWYHPRCYKKLLSE